MCARARACVCSAGAPGLADSFDSQFSVSLFFFHSTPSLGLSLFVFHSTLSFVSLSLFCKNQRTRGPLFLSLEKEVVVLSLSLVMSFCLFISLVPLHSRPWNAATERGSAWTVAALRVRSARPCTPRAPLRSAATETEGLQYVSSCGRKAPEIGSCIGTRSISDNAYEGDETRVQHSAKPAVCRLPACAPPLSAQLAVF